VEDEQKGEGVKAWDEGGRQRDATGAEIHRFDQMQKRFRDLTGQLLDMQRTAQVIFNSDGPDVRNDLAEMHQELQGLLQELMEEGPSIASSYIMYLISAILSMEEAEGRKQKLAEVLFRAMSLLLPADHDMYGMGADLGDVEQILAEAFGPREDREPSYTTSTGQELVNVHRADSCQGFCVIHNPCPGPWDSWGTHWRGDGPFDIWRGFERLCPCGVGHPAVEEIMRGNNPGSHGCCGVCRCSPADCVAKRDDRGNLIGFE
jgi:hypothetical protein